METDSGLPQLLAKYKIKSVTITPKSSSENQKESNKQQPVIPSTKKSITLVPIIGNTKPKFSSTRKVYTYIIEGDPLDDFLDPVIDPDAKKEKNIVKDAKGNIRYQCEKCPSSFRRKNHLIEHEEQHRGIPFNCNLCDKSYSSKRNLRLHMQKHAGIRFPCDLCDQTFLTKVNLKAHVLIHEGIKFICSECGKEFAQKRNLKVHELCHLGTRFLCHLCPKSYSQKCQLNMHVKEKHTPGFIP